jgi:uncharacterized repeat protein (TIGR01451 family)
MCAYRARVIDTPPPASLVAPAPASPLLSTPTPVLPHVQPAPPGPVPHVAQQPRITPPSMTPSGVAADLDVRVAVAGSDTVMVGDPVTFEITVTNRSSLAASNLLITDHFDPGLEHEAAATPIEKDLGELAPGQSHVIGVTFRVTQPGRLCNRVEVRAASGARGAAQGCVTAVMPAQAAGQRPPQTGQPAETPSAERATVQVKVSGPPAAANVDAVAEFFIDLSNTGERDLTNLTLTATSDASLVPMQATDGYEWDDRENLVWKIPALAAGKSVRLQINARCQSAAQQACVRVRVAAHEGAAAEGEACLTIRGGESRLSMEVHDLADPVTLGSPGLTYEVQITNTGSVPDRNVALTVVVPPEMKIIPLGTFGDKTTHEIEMQNVRFKPVAALAPGEKLVYHVRVKPLQAGDVTLEAIFNSEGQPQPQTVTQKTTILERSE